MLEWTNSNQRSRIGAATQFFYVFGVLLLALCAYLLQDWKDLQIVIACANLSVLGFYWMAPESLQWLLLNGKHEQARKSAQFVARFNGIRLQEGHWELMQKISHNGSPSGGENREKQYTVLDCFRTRKMFVLTLLSCYIW